MTTLELFQNLCIYGNVYETNHRIKKTEEFVDWTEENFKYVDYNPRKKIARKGLSITSLNGTLSGIPDLDSLYEYNCENNTSYNELDFTVPTPVYNYPSISYALDPIKDCISRTHIIKLQPGGFFPPHRDTRGVYLESFRLLVPLKNSNPPKCNFVLEDKIMNWNEGSFYFINTCLMHYIFNSSMSDSYILVANVKLCEKSVRYVTENLKYK